jgi:hypothetical protein
MKRLYGFAVERRPTEMRYDPIGVSIGIEHRIESHAFAGQ